MEKCMNAEEFKAFMAVSEQHGALVEWLRKYPGFRFMRPSPAQCLARFPLLDDARVREAMSQVHDERASEVQVIAGDWALIHFCRRFGLPPRNESRELPAEVRKELKRIGDIVGKALGKRPPRRKRRNA